MLRSRRTWNMVGLIGVLGWTLAQEAVTPGKPPLEKDAAIARVEELKGSVGIDGDAPGQPVWKVDLSGTSVRGSDLVVLEAFPDLEVLDLSGTAIVDQDLIPLRRLGKLRDLNLAETKVTDECIPELLRIPGLRELSLLNTAITDAGLLPLAQHPGRPEVIVEGTSVTPQGLARFHEARESAPVVKPESPDPARRFNDLGRLILLGADRQRRTIERGVEYLERAVIAAPENDQYKLDLADAYAVLNNDLTLAAAIDLYEDVLERRPDDEQLLAQIGRAYSSLGNLEQAQEAVERRLRLVPVDGAFDVVTQIVGVVAIGGDRDWAIQQIRTAVRKSPSDRRIQLLLAGLLIEARQNSEAQTIARRIDQETDLDHPLREAVDDLLTSLNHAGSEDLR